MSWLVRHVEIIQNRFGIRTATGLTLFETVNNRPYRGELLPWLSPCMVRAQVQKISLHILRLGGNLDWILDDAQIAMSTLSSRRN
eukprot:7940748-Heterocapsa_arctica.AAC.1